MSRHWSEDIACKYLLEQGYILLETNYHIRAAEIDLIMRDNEFVVFIEVKQRKDINYGTPLASINSRKLQRLSRAALHYITSNFQRDDLPIRFDAVGILGTKDTYVLEHLKNIYV